MAQQMDPGTDPLGDPHLPRLSEGMATTLWLFHGQGNSFPRVKIRHFLSTVPEFAAKTKKARGEYVRSIIKRFDRAGYVRREAGNTLDHINGSDLTHVRVIDEDALYCFIIARIEQDPSRLDGVLSVIKAMEGNQVGKTLIRRRCTILRQMISKATSFTEDPKSKETPQ